MKPPGPSIRYRVAIGLASAGGVKGPGCSGFRRLGGAIPGVVLVVATARHQGNSRQGTWAGGLVGVDREVALITDPRVVGVAAQAVDGSDMIVCTMRRIVDSSPDTDRVGHALPSSVVGLLGDQGASAVCWSADTPPLTTSPMLGPPVAVRRSQRPVNRS